MGAAMTRDEFYRWCDDPSIFPEEDLGRKPQMQFDGCGMLVCEAGVTDGGNVLPITARVKTPSPRPLQSDP